MDTHSPILRSLRNFTCTLAFAKYTGNAPLKQQIMIGCIQLKITMDVGSTKSRILLPMLLQFFSSNLLQLICPIPD
ncbi:hypothetical protein FKM82_019185 [Ascaphus truei]